MRWWQISNTPLYQQPWMQPRRRGAQLWLDQETKQNKKRDAARKRGIHFVFACHLLDMIITAKQGRRGLSQPHLYQQAGIKLSNYPPRPLARPPTLLPKLVPFASSASSQTLSAGMWKHILMTALFQSVLIGIYTLYMAPVQANTQKVKEKFNGSGVWIYCCTWSE